MNESIMQNTHKHESTEPVTAKSADENGLVTEHAKDIEVEEDKGDELAAEFPVNGIVNAPKAFNVMDMPSLELADDFNSTDSDSFAARTQKNRTLEMKLSAIIEKACSSDVEAEDHTNVPAIIEKACSSDVEAEDHTNVSANVEQACSPNAEAEDHTNVPTIIEKACSPIAEAEDHTNVPAIIEKACSSNAEAEDHINAQPPTLPATNVTVTLPNNEVLFTVEGVSVPVESTSVPVEGGRMPLEAVNAVEETASNLITQEDAVVPSASDKTVASGRRKIYMYKLKSKGGIVLKYSSYVPVVLKKPRINLTRIEVGTTFNVNTTTKNAKRKASSTSPLVNGKRGRGRPTKTSLTPATVDFAVEVPDVKPNNSNSSFGMQTRKRKLKFLPDGRLQCIAKRSRSSSSSSSSISDDRDGPPIKESTDEDWQASADDLRELNSLSDDKEMPTERKSATKSQTPKSSKSATSKLTKIGSPKLTKVSTMQSADVGKAAIANKAASGPTTPVSKPPARGTTVNVNPAQLLSTLLGVTIRPNQLNTVRFKPKTVQKQHPSLQKTIVLTGEELKGVAANFRSSTSLKAATPKPLMQKIFPRTSLSAILNKTVNAKPSPSTNSTQSMALNRNSVSSVVTTFSVEPPSEMPNFDNFTDSRTVRTKAGPKKCLLQRELNRNEKLNRLTIYDLAQNVFDRMPTWNLHLMPDTKTFCIAQIGRGRMGMPILRKSVELNDNFAAKIFVHQLHCKKFDGVYDTEEKINSLIADIDSLAA